MDLKKQNFIQTINANRGIIKSVCQLYYCSREDQKDAFQDIVLQLWKSFDSFRGESQITTWIYRVSLNTMLSNIRRDKKSIIAESFDISHFSISHAKADDNIELLYLIIQSLNDVDKAIVMLHLEGYGNREIAEILEMTSTNISTRFSRLKSQLKVKIKNKSHATK